MKSSTLRASTKPMKRSPLHSKTADTLTVKVKQAKCANKACRKLFAKRNMQHVACSVDCAVAVVREKAEKERIKLAKESRIATRVAKEESLSVKEHLKLTEKVINRYVRLRDYYEGCCSCDKPSHWDGQWHASHYKSVGSNSLLRFHLWNIHKGCSECNRHKSGNIAEYTERLRLRFGSERIQWLEDRKNGSKDYTSEYLIRMRRIFSKKCKRLEKRLGL
jgi:hypothetical protein